MSLKMVLCVQLPTNILVMSLVFSRPILNFWKILSITDYSLHHFLLWCFGVTHLSVISHSLLLFLNHINTSSKFLLLATMLATVLAHVIEPQSPWRVCSVKAVSFNKWSTLCVIALLSLISFAKLLVSYLAE